MIHIRKTSDRGYFDHGWLKALHTFSFGDFYDPDHMGFQVLRVINEDRVAPGKGFGTHPHRDMEIITYMIEGSLQHKDSMGNGSIIKRGEIQYMSAGSGVTHSEFNPSPDEVAHLLQIWILPKEKGLPPRYGQIEFGVENLENGLVLLASPDGQKKSMAIRQDVYLYGSKLSRGKSVEHSLGKGRSAWIQMVSGQVDLNGTKLLAGDGAALSSETQLRILSLQDASEFLLFDLR